MFLLALALSRDGLPFAHEVLAGNTPDVVTVKTAIDRLRRRFQVRQCLFVGDRGMVSEDNLRWLRSQDVHYIMGAPMRRSKEVKESVLGRAGRYQEVQENLHVKEVEVDGRRYIICFNPKEAVRDRKTRESILADGSLRLDRTRVKAEARYDGKYVLHTSHPELAKEEVARAYRQLMMVERGHVFVCVLAHLLEQVLERQLGQGGIQDLTASRTLAILNRLQLVPHLKLHFPFSLTRRGLWKGGKYPTPTSVATLTPFTPAEFAGPGSGVRVRLSVTRDITHLGGSLRLCAGT